MVHGSTGGASLAIAVLKVTAGAEPALTTTAPAFFTSYKLSRLAIANISYRAIVTVIHYVLQIFSTLTSEEIYRQMHTKDLAIS